jgi:GNAT superfamily N-acetyltransferase
VVTEEVELSSPMYQQCKPELMKVRNANRDDVRDGNYFDWRYLGRPGGRPPVIVLARNGKGEAVGALSLIPHSYWVDNALATVGLLGDISVAREWRGKNIAQQMLRFLAQLDAVKNLRCCLVLPNEPAARPLEKSGWSGVSSLNRYIRVVSIERLLQKRSFPGWLAKALSFVITPGYERMFSVSAPVRADAYDLAIVDTIDSQFDELWKSIEKSGMVIACRDSDHLSWRFARHPLRKYRFLVLKLGTELQGYVAFHANGDNSYIDDIFCRNVPGLPAYLMRAFVTSQRNSGAMTTINIQINRNYVSAATMSRLGFSRRSDCQRVMVLPRTDVIDDLALLSTRNWFMTIGDKDI